MEENIGRAVKLCIESHGEQDEVYSSVLEQTLTGWSDAGPDKKDIILTVGGTGVGTRNAVPDITCELLDQELPGLAQEATQAGDGETWWLNRCKSGIRNSTIILNLPSKKPARCLKAVSRGLLRCAGQL